MEKTTLHLTDFVKDDQFELHSYLMYLFHHFERLASYPVNA